MDIQIREYTKEDTKEAIRIWNHIVEECISPNGMSHRIHGRGIFHGTVLYRDWG